MRAAAMARAPMSRGRVLRRVQSGVTRRMIVLGLIAVGLALAQVWLRLQVRAVAYELSELRRIQTKLQHRERELQIQFAMEREPARLRAMAVERLGMQEPKRGQVVDLP